MATNYTTKKVEADYEIYRNGIHVATYDPVTDDTTYTHGNDKYATPIGKEVAAIKNPPAEEPPAEEQPAERTPLEGETEFTNRIAGICYDNYCARVGGKAFNGDPLPNWEEFSSDPEKQIQANAWRGVGIDAEEIVCDQFDKERPSGPISDMANENNKLKKHVASLEGEVRDLRNQRDGVEVDRTPDRYKGIPINPEGAPIQDPAQGDTTPEFVAWARVGGYTAEQFQQVYSGRLTDLTYPTPKEKEGK